MNSCESCGDGSAYFDGLCIRCNARKNGEKCQKCGSPWVYIHAYMSDQKPKVPLCKPCCYTFIGLSGYLDDLEEVIERAKQREEKSRGKPQEAIAPVVAAEKEDSGQEFLTFDGQ